MQDVFVCGLDISKTVKAAAKVFRGMVKIGCRHDLCFSGQNIDLFCFVQHAHTHFLGPSVLQMHSDCKKIVLVGGCRSHVDTLVRSLGFNDTHAFLHLHCCDITLHTMVHRRWLQGLRTQ